MAKEGITGDEAVKAHYKAICEIVDGDVSAEVISTKFEGMIAEGQALAALHPNIVVKVPAIADGIRAIRWFTDNGIRTNCTLIFSPGQALLAAKAGASYVSPFVGRIDDISLDGLQLIEKIRVIYDNYDFGTEILAASVRHTMHIIECAEIGADIMTGPLSAIKGLLKHPLTDNGLAQFLADHAKVRLMLLRIHPDNPDERRLDQAVALLERDGVIVVPTDTVYSFACVLGSAKGRSACPPSK